MYDYTEGFKPNIVNSWDLIYQYAKQYKQNNIIKSTIDDLKNETYINILK